ncbi:MAG: YciI family protein [Candidatus Melainabacteria bacterium]|nr:YciI family protein [Candidatus Melainabacteria bacterium]
MQFVIIGKDAKDPEALQRRQQYREAHLQRVEALKNSGNGLLGGALLSKHNQMMGSMLVVEFPDRAAVEAWLAEEPYVQGKVWDQVEVYPYAIPPVFQPALSLLRGEK